MNRNTPSLMASSQVPWRQHRISTLKTEPTLKSQPCIKLEDSPQRTNSSVTWFSPTVAQRLKHSGSITTCNHLSKSSRTLLTSFLKLSWSRAKSTGIRFRETLLEKVRAKIQRVHFIKAVMDSTRSTGIQYRLAKWDTASSQSTHNRITLHRR